MIARNLLLPFVVGLALRVAPSLAAQGPAQRSRLAALEDSLAHTADSAALLSREARVIERAKADRDNPMIHLELGLLALRLGRLAGSPDHLDDAGSEFEWAAELKPEWPWPWYGLGLTEFELVDHPLQPVVGLNRIRNALDLDEVNKSARAFEHALDTDPDFAPALGGLAEAALREQGASHLENTLRRLRDAAGRPASRSPVMQLARGRLERQIGSADSALAAFRTYLRAGGDSGVGLLEVSRTLFDLNRTREAIATWQDASEHVRSDDAVSMMRSDIGWIATAEELREWDGLSAGGRAPWLAGFWRERDLESGHAAGERLAEHYRRWFVVMRNFRRPASLYRERDLIYPYHGDQRLVDDRGVVYMRHGEPDEVVGFAGSGTEGANLPVNQSWLYYRPEGNLILHFRGASGHIDYRLIESLIDVYGYEAGVALQAGAFENEHLPVLSTDPDKLRGPRMLFASRGGLDPAYDRLAVSPSLGRGPQLAAERERGRKAIATATTTDSYLLHYAHPVHAVIQRYGLAPRGPGSSRLLLVYALPAGDLDAGTRDSLPLRLHVIAIDSLERIIETDTVRMIASPPAGGMAVGLLDVAVPPGQYRLTAVLEAGNDRGRALRWDGVVVPALGGRGVELSDLVLGRPGGLAWRGGGRPVDLNPGNAFAGTDTLSLYYEVAGVAPGMTYRTRIEVQRTDRGLLEKVTGRDHRPFVLGFEEQASASPMRSDRSVDLQQIPAGDYRITVTLERPSGEVLATRTSDFRVDR